MHAFYALQKKRLLPLHKKARQEGKKATWKIMGDEYQLYIDGVDGVKHGKKA